MSEALSLGPLLYNWRAEVWRDFHLRIADEAPVDTVHLGEVVCSKRSSARHFDEVIRRLQVAGKEVVVSTLALVMSDSESAALHRLVDKYGDGCLIEANDISAVAALAGRRHVVGPFVNVYNEGTLAVLAGLGACRVCLPAEVPAGAIGIMARLGTPEIEVQVFGRLPLALSARCYHARSRGLAKDGCRTVCAEDPDGLPVDTIDGTPFLSVNGTQTMSHHTLDLLPALSALRAAGVHRFRLWPQRCDMVAVAGLYRDVVDGRADPVEADRKLAELLPTVDFANGYLYARQGCAWVDEDLIV
jgi:collagenase-like PrtC family protease